MNIFSNHRKKMEPRRRFGSMAFRKKIKLAASYKRVFNPTGFFSLNIIPTRGKIGRVAIAGGILIFLVVGYYLIISPALLITQITIRGNVQITSQKIQDVLIESGNSRFFFIKKNNFFLMTTGRINQLLTSNIPTVKEVVNFRRSWPNKATIEISERLPGFVIESAGLYFLIDEEGVVVSQTEDVKKLPIAHDQLVENFARGEILPNQKLTSFILSMNKLWNTKITVPVAMIKFSGKSGNDVQYVTATGWGVLFDATRSVSVQLANLTVMLKEIKLSDQANLAYIDLRLDKLAYYCFKASPCQEQATPLDAGTNINVDP